MAVAEGSDHTAMPLRVVRRVDHRCGRGHGGNCGGGRVGLRRLSPGWNWPSKAMWYWGRREVSRGSMSPRRPLGRRPERRRYAPTTTQMEIICDRADIGLALVDALPF